MIPKNITRGIVIGTIVSVIVKLLEYLLRFKYDFLVEQITLYGAIIDILYIFVFVTFLALLFDYIKLKDKYSILFSPTYFAFKDIVNYIRFGKLLTVSTLTINIPFVFIAVPLSLALSLMLYKIIGGE